MIHKILSTQNIRKYICVHGSMNTRRKYTHIFRVQNFNELSHKNKTVIVL